jgi:dTMP kinase
MMSATSAALRPRGAFILFEGVDRCGKTTQAKRLAEALASASPGGKGSVFMRFPDRETAIGSQINAYLTNSADLDDHAVHLLFSANRWEKR